MTTHRVTVQVTVTIDPPLPDVTPSPENATTGHTKFWDEQTAYVTTDVVRPVAAVIGADMLPRMLAREATP